METLPIKFWIHGSSRINKTANGESELQRKWRPSSSLEALLVSMYSFALPPLLTLLSSLLDCAANCADFSDLAMMQIRVSDEISLNQKSRPTTLAVL